MHLKTIQDVKNLRGKKVLVRVDFNVPMHNGQVIDDFKMRAALPTIQYLQKKGAGVILVTHLGRPSKPDTKLSTLALAKHLGGLLHEKIVFKPFEKDFLNHGIIKSPPGWVVMLENVRFYPEEEKNDKRFARWLASLADLFVFDGFAVAHRDAASVTGVAKLLPTYAGLLLAEEIKQLSALQDKPKKPFIVILGGAKVETKIPVLKKVLSKADYILVGGGIANTWAAAQGNTMGSSLVGKDHMAEIVRYCSNKKVILPVDYIVGDEKGSKAYTIAADDFSLSKKEGVYDIGPATVELFSRYIKKAQTIVWNGAMGKFEVDAYGYATKALACLIAARSKGRAFGVVGGGETVEVIEALGLRSDLDWVSTGGGAMLDFMSGKKLPGIQIVLKK